MTGSVLVQPVRICSQATGVCYELVGPKISVLQFAAGSAFTQVADTEIVLDKILQDIEVAKPETQVEQVRAIMDFHKEAWCWDDTKIQLLIDILLGHLGLDMTEKRGRKRKPMEPEPGAVEALAGERPLAMEALRLPPLAW